MKNRLSDWLTVILFCGFLFVMLLLYLVTPKKDFSVSEKRYLAEAPETNWDSISSGDWGDEIEIFLADHIPGRNFYVGLNAYFEWITGRQSAKDIWVSDGRLIESPVVWSDTSVKKHMDAIQAFSEKVGQPIDIAIIPSAGWATEIDGYCDRDMIEQIYALASEPVQPVDMTAVFEGRDDLYYKTDHHWTSAGAFEAYQAYMRHVGKPEKCRTDFEIETVPNFQGSTYSRSALWLTPAEDLELWYGCDRLTVINAESSETHAGVFYPDRLEEADKYTVFLDGNHSLVRITNPYAEGKLLVIRDSYSNCLGCFLAESYAEVVLVDLRYYKQPVSDLVSQEDFDNILICYSIGNFLTDTNIVWLR